MVYAIVTFVLCAWNHTDSPPLPQTLIMSLFFSVTVQNLPLWNMSLWNMCSLDTRYNHVLLKKDWVVNTRNKLVFFFNQIVLWSHIPKIKNSWPDFLSLNQHRILWSPELLPSLLWIITLPGLPWKSQRPHTQHFLLVTKENNIMVQAHCCYFYYVLRWLRHHNTEQGWKDGRVNSYSHCI